MAKYTTSQGDTWDIAAYKAYKKERYMHKLVEANPKYINIAVFPANCVLNIPEITEEEKPAFPPWRSGT